MYKGVKKQQYLSSVRREARQKAESTFKNSPAGEKRLWYDWRIKIKIVMDR